MLPSLQPRRSPILIAAWYVASLTSLAPAQAWARQYALLIGINEYATVPDLTGAVNDVIALQQVLVRRWGFHREDVRLLTDGMATRQQILAALDELRRTLGPQDELYLHFSGHGSQVEDQDGDESVDRLDETLVPQDGRMPGIADITDDELRARLGQLRARNILVVLDACHSGTGLRATGVRVRAVGADRRRELYRARTVFRGGAAPVAPADNPALIAISSARADELALDGLVDGDYRGFFSHALTRGLARAKPGSSARELFALAGDELQRVQLLLGRRSMPEPQIEGTAQRLDQPLWPSGTATVSTQMDVTAPPAVLSLDGAAIRWQPVLESALRADGAELLLERDAPIARYRVRKQGIRADLLSGDGLQLLGRYPLDTTAGAANLVRLLTRQQRSLELQTLGNPASQIVLELRVPDDRIEARDIARWTSGVARMRFRLAGEPRDSGNSLQLEARANRHVYLTIIDIDAAGRVTQLFPTPAQEPAFLPEGRVPVDRWTRIPDSLDSGNAAGFHWDFGPPAGLDTLRVFATTDLATTHWLRTLIRSASNTGDAAASLPALRSGLNQRAIRGLQVVADQVDSAAQSDWTAASLQFEVIDPRAETKLSPRVAPAPR
jgi:hypothetical protein